jgi:hypothetical protein
MIAAFHTVMRYVASISEPNDIRATPFMYSTLFRSMMRDERVWIDMLLFVLALMPLFDSKFDDLWTPSFLHMFSMQKTTRDLFLLWLYHYPKVKAPVLFSARLHSSMPCSL